LGLQSWAAKSTADDGKLRSAINDQFACCVAMLAGEDVHRGQRAASLTVPVAAGVGTAG
jgi:hypothetical protein